VLLDVPSDAVPGDYDVGISFHHWITGAPLRRVHVRIVVTP
jgi:hypothetical protein